MKRNLQGKYVRTEEDFKVRREKALKWFDSQDAYNKSELSHKYFKDTVSYNFTCLTGREIEQIWKAETVDKNVLQNQFDDINNLQEYIVKLEQMLSLWVTYSDNDESLSAIKLREETEKILLK